MESTNQMFKLNVPLALRCKENSLLATTWKYICYLFMNVYVEDLQNTRLNESFILIHNSSFTLQRSQSIENPCNSQKDEGEVCSVVQLYHSRFILMRYGWALTKKLLNLAFTIEAVCSTGWPAIIPFKIVNATIALRNQLWCKLRDSRPLSIRIVTINTSFMARYHFHA